MRLAGSHTPGKPTSPPRGGGYRFIPYAHRRSTGGQPHGLRATTGLSSEPTPRPGASRSRPRGEGYFFLPGPPDVACVDEKGETGTFFFAFGCLGFFGSLLLLSCPLAIRNSPHACLGGRPDPVAGGTVFVRAEALSKPANSGVSKCERNRAGVKRRERSRVDLVDVPGAFRFREAAIALSLRDFFTRQLGPSDEPAAQCAAALVAAVRTAG